MKQRILSLLVIASMLILAFTTVAASPNKNIGINVLLNTEITDPILVDLGTHGKVRDLLPEINALTMQARASELDVIRALPYVEYANPDATRNGAPVDTVMATDFMNGLSTWDLDAINVTDFGFNNREVEFDGTGVYVAVIDTGLVDTWRQVFPEERIAEEFARSFSGGGGEVGFVSEQPNKWEHDQNSHGTHVASTIIGYNLRGTPVNGVAPMATIIPVKVLNQNGSGWSSVVARGITYIADLKKSGALGDSPVVINMSLGGPSLDAMEKAAIDYAIAEGVIVVASAGNAGTRGMGYPGAYEPVISVAASGWVGEWTAGAWWYALNVVDPTNPEHFYITSFSSRELSGQDLDVAAPGSWVVGPYKLNSSNFPTYYYLGGTSMAAPHVAGIAALIMQKNAVLMQHDIEGLLVESAIPLPAGCRLVTQSNGLKKNICWDDDATGAGLVDAAAALAAAP